MKKYIHRPLYCCVTQGSTDVCMVRDIKYLFGQTFSYPQALYLMTYFVSLANHSAAVVIDSHLC